MGYRILIEEQKRQRRWNWVIGIAVGILFTFLFIKGEGWKGLQAPTMSDQEIKELIVNK